MTFSYEARVGPSLQSVHYLQPRLSNFVEALVPCRFMLAVPLLTEIINR